jgi:integrase
MSTKRRRPPKKRGNNEGSIWQRKDGRWCAALSLGIVRGRKRRKTVYGATRAEVAEKLKALHAQQQTGANLTPERITVAGYLALWLEQVVTPTCRPRTLESYAGVTRRYLVPHLGHHQLAALTPAHVQQMLNDLKARGLSPRTVAYARGVLQRALNRAIKWEYVGRNVATLADAPRQIKPQIVPLDATQARALLAAVQGHRLEALYRLALGLGLRKGELCGLLWRDLDWGRQTLAISGAVGWEEGILVRAEPKTAAGLRTLPLSPALLDALREHQQRQQDEASGPDWNTLGLIFPSEAGTLLNPRNVVRHFKGLLIVARLPSRVRFHDLRHTCATLLISQGIHPRVVMELLGHSAISVTMNTYAHALPADQRSAAAALDALLTPVATSVATHEAPKTDEPPSSG